MRQWWLLLLGLALSAMAAAHGVSVQPWSAGDLPLVHRLQAPTVVPALPENTSPLRFEQFFRMPVGPRGLELTPTLRALDGRRVRLFGYMVLHDSPSAGVFLLSPMPITLAEQADGAADDLPPAVVTVRFPPALSGRVAPYVPGILMVEGILGVGDRDEPDGRRSLVRLQLDWPVNTPAAGVLQ